MRVLGIINGNRCFVNGGLLSCAGARRLRVASASLDELPSLSRVGRANSSLFYLFIYLLIFSLVVFTFFSFFFCTKRANLLRGFLTVS